MRIDAAPFRFVDDIEYDDDTYIDDTYTNTYDARR